jgi:hypothetical protein
LPSMGRAPLAKSTTKRRENERALGKPSLTGTKALLWRCSDGTTVASSTRDFHQDS